MKKTFAVLLLLLIPLSSVKAETLLEGIDITGWIDSIVRATPARGIEAGNYIRIFGEVEKRNRMATIKFKNEYYVLGSGMRDSFDHPINIPLLTKVSNNPTLTYRGPLFSRGREVVVDVGKISSNFNWYIADFRYFITNGISLSNLQVGPFLTEAFLTWPEDLASPAFGLKATYRTISKQLEIGYVGINDNEVAAEAGGVKEFNKLGTEQALSLDYTYRNQVYGIFNFVGVQQINTSAEAQDIYNVSHLRYERAFPEKGVTLKLDWRDYHPLFEPRFRNKSSIGGRNPLFRYSGEKGSTLEIQYRDKELTGSFMLNSFVNRKTEPLLDHFQTKVDVNVPFGSLRVGTTYLYDILTETTPLTTIRYYAPEYLAQLRVNLRNPVTFGTLVLQPSFELRQQRFNARMPDNELLVQGENFWNVMLSASTTRNSPFRGLSWKIGYKVINYEFERPFSENNFQNGRHLWGELRYRTPAGISVSINFCTPKIKDGYWNSAGTFITDDRFVYRNNLIQITYRKTF